MKLHLMQIKGVDSLTSGLPGVEFFHLLGFKDVPYYHLTRRLAIIQFSNGGMLPGIIFCSVFYISLNEAYWLIEVIDNLILLHSNYI